MERRIELLINSTAIKVKMAQTVSIQKEIFFTLSVSSAMRGLS